jgi:hypothetical protein
MEDWNIPGRPGGVRMAVGVGGMGVAVFVGIAVGGSGMNVTVGNGVSVALETAVPHPDNSKAISNTIKWNFLNLFIVDSFSIAYKFI